jgi:hypothetical protein
MKRTLIVTLLLALIPAAAAQAVYYSGDKEMERFLSAKEAVYDREWEKAHSRMESYLQRYPDGRYEEEARYWMARSLNQMSREANKAPDMIRLKKRSIENLDTLLGKFPESIWKDDAKMLRLEVAAQLALLGDQEARHYIQEIVTEENREEVQLQKVALAALVELGPEIALPVVETVLNENTNPELRQTAVSLVGRMHGTEALPLLRHLEAEDKDPEVREIAAKWRKKAEMRAIPVYLNYFGFVARLKDGDDTGTVRVDGKREAIAEDKLTVFEFPARRDADKGDVQKALKRLFDGSVKDIRFAANGTVGMDLGGELAKYNYQMSVSHNLAGFRVSVPDEGVTKTHWDIAGKASFFDKVTDREYVNEFVVDKDNAWLMTMRHGEEIALLVVMFESTQEPVEEKDEPVYYTEINNPNGSVVHSSRQSWDAKEFDASVVEYGRAKVEIAGDGGTWVLIGHIQYHRKANLYVGHDARLYDPKREVVAEGMEIRVPADTPDKFEVKGGKQ